MKINARDRIAIDSLLILHLCTDSKPVSLMEIASHQHVSLSYLEMIFTRLRKAGIVRSARGPGGGYVINRELASIKVSDVVKAVRDMDNSTRRKKSPKTHVALNAAKKAEPFWSAVDHYMMDFLKKITLHDVLEQRHTLFQDVA